MVDIEYRRGVDPTQAVELGLAPGAIARSVGFRRPVARSLHVGLCALVGNIRHPETSTVPTYDIAFEPMHSDDMPACVTPRGTPCSSK